MTRVTTRWRWLAACSGGIAGPVLWAMSTQAGQILPYIECASRYRPVVVLSAIAMGLCVSSAFLSWLTPSPSRAALFTSRVCALLGLLFAFTLLLQAAAAAVLTGCER